MNVQRTSLVFLLAALITACSGCGSFGPAPETFPERIDAANLTIRQAATAVADARDAGVITQAQSTSYAEMLQAAAGLVDVATEAYYAGRETEAGSDLERALRITLDVERALTQMRGR